MESQAAFKAIGKKSKLVSECKAAFRELMDYIGFHDPGDIITKRDH